MFVSLLVVSTTIVISGFAWRIWKALNETPTAEAIARRNDFSDKKAENALLRRKRLSVILLLTNKQEEEHTALFAKHTAMSKAEDAVLGKLDRTARCAESLAKRMSS